MNVASDRVDKPGTTRGGISARRTARERELPLTCPHSFTLCPHYAALTPLPAETACGAITSKFFKKRKEDDIPLSTRDVIGPKIATFSSLYPSLDDHLGATAIIDRLLHRSHVIVINGPSYREWVHLQGTEAPNNDG